MATIVQRISAKGKTKVANDSISSLGSTSDSDSDVNSESSGIPNISKSDRKYASHYEWLHRYDGELYPKHVSIRMICSSAFMSIAGCYAYYLGFNDFAISVALVVIIAINFWRKPQRGFRRNIDMINTYSSVGYHTYCAYMELDTSLSLQYWLMEAFGGIIYLTSKSFARKQMMNYDSFFHCLMHVWGTVINVWLYNQLIDLREIDE